MKPNHIHFQFLPAPPSHPYAHPPKKNKHQVQFVLLIYFLEHSQAPRGPFVTDNGVLPYPTQTRDVYMIPYCCFVLFLLFGDLPPTSQINT